MAQYLYTIPSAMNDGKWNVIHIAFQEDKKAAIYAYHQHYRLTEVPQEVEIHVRRKTRPNRIRAYRITAGTGYDDFVVHQLPHPIPPDQKVGA